MAEFDIVDIESLDVNPDGTFYAWLRAQNGAGLLWELDLSKSPGEMQTLHAVAGA